MAKRFLDTLMESRRLTTRHVKHLLPVETQEIDLRLLQNECTLFRRDLDVTIAASRCPMVSKRKLKCV